MKRRQAIPQRSRIFVGCEGESEQSYVAVIQRHLGAAAAFHLVGRVLNGGDPLALMESARKALRDESTKGRDPFVRRFMLLDSDLRGRSRDRDAACIALAEAQAITLIWQEPCHEAMLLRHLNGCENRRPATTAASLDALQHEWPRYRKNMAAQELAARIDRASLEQAIRTQVESEPLLRSVGLP
jgi:hypothetical protein